MNNKFLSVEDNIRITGYDIARALAVLGMILVNFKVVLWNGFEGPGWLKNIVGIFEGRAAATFVVLAGIGISLLSRRARLSGDGALVKADRVMLLKRSLFLLAGGLLYTPIWPADILHFYALYIAIGVFFLAAPAKRLMQSTLTVTVLFPVLCLFMDYGKGWDFSTLTYLDFWSFEGMVRHLFFNGFHPVFPWLAFLLLGMWIGRRDLREPRVRRRIFLPALGVFLIVEILSKLLLKLVPPAAMELSAEEARFLLGTSPMPPMPFYMLSGGATAVIVICFCVWLGQKAADGTWVKPFIRTGQSALTLYVAHVVIGMGVMEGFGLLQKLNLVEVVFYALFFGVISILFSFLWLGRFRRGPFEWLMRKIAG